LFELPLGLAREFLSCVNSSCDARLKLRIIFPPRQTGFSASLHSIDLATSIVSAVPVPASSLRPKKKKSKEMNFAMFSNVPARRLTFTVSTRLGIRSWRAFSVVHRCQTGESVGIAVFTSVCTSQPERKPKRTKTPRTSTRHFFIIPLDRIQARRYACAAVRRMLKGLLRKTRNSALRLEDRSENSQRRLGL